MNQVRYSRPRFAGQASRQSAALRGQRGLTLIELMVAVLVASILIGFVFEIQGRMSSAFRTQTNISSLQQAVRAANELIARDARLTGFMMPNGVRVSSEFVDGLPGLTTGLVQNDGMNNFVPALSVFNNPDGRTLTQMQPDRVHFFYADPDPMYHAVVESIISRNAVQVNTQASFAPGDLLLFTRRDPSPIRHPLGDDLPVLVRYFACVARLTDTVPSGTTIVFRIDPDPGPYNTATNDHCFQSVNPGEEVMAANTTEKTQVFRLVARAYRIDTTRLQIAPLQRSDTGGLGDGIAEDWQEVGIGFVDLQISQRYVEPVSDGNDPDNDGNFRMDWHATAATIPPGSQLTQLGIGLVARTIRGVEGVRTAAVPVLTRLNFENGTDLHNPFGDAGGPKDMMQPEYNPELNLGRGGDHVYRHSKSIVDIRNLGVSF